MNPPILPSPPPGAGRALPGLLAAALLALPLVAWTFLGLRDRPAVLDLADGWLLAPDRWRGLDRERLEWMLTTTRGGVRQPLAWLSLAIDDRLSPGAAARLHDTNVALHVLAAALVGALVFLVLRRTGAGRLWRIGAPLAAAITAAAWAVHPLRVEPAALLGARGDLLATVFGLAATCAWFLAVSGPALGRRWLAAAVAGSVLGSLASPLAAGFVPAWWALARWTRRAVPGSHAADAPVGGPLALVAAAPVLAVVATLAVRAPAAPAPFGAHVADLAEALVAPLWRTLAPAGLHPFREPPPGFPDEVPSASWVRAGIAALLVVAAIRGARRGSGAGLALAAGLAAAALAWLVLPDAAGSDRAAHVATLPLFVAAGIWLGDGAGCLLAFLGVPLVVGAIALPSVASRTLAGAWRDDASLSTHVLERDPANDRVAGHLAESALRRGSTAEAEARALRSLRAGGRRPHAEAALALAALERGDVAAAESGFERAVRGDPGHAAAQRHLGVLRLRRGRTDEAVRGLETAVRLDAESPAAWFALGQARVAAGDRSGAAAAFRRALALDPDDGRVREELDRLR